MIGLKDQGRSTVAAASDSNVCEHECLLVLCFDENNHQALQLQLCARFDIVGNESDDTISGHVVLSVHEPAEKQIVSLALSELICEHAKHDNKEDENAHCDCLEDLGFLLCSPNTSV
mgnify:CR=1 FL=1